ncbi:MAG: bifunctional folylpolyglutamate synthase/dihydrofolate synthase [Candidatus Omnitrophica bacterium]|jgi:dihydrofolate synthase/folylpolyglutamate synthase|nr:bifunctional folylpolyglutamate synthase/dihydrofolate synthase [Candidatus Omnitrophota bacterium]
MSYKNYSIKNFNDAKNYLDTFVNYEKNTRYPYGKTLKLKRVESLLKSLDIDCTKFKSIHIAGTKGKGSTACFCASLLASAGCKTGLYTSPHFFDFRERIQILTENRKQSTEYRKKIKSSLISKNDVVRLIREMQSQLEKLRYTKELGALSFFEVYTALAFKYFLEKKVDFVVLETGLGGRLDATNVVSPLVSIITHIGYDHMDKLGDTLAEIAQEKAGIIKKNIDVVSARQAPSIRRVISVAARKMKSRLFSFGRAFQSTNEYLGSQDTSFDFHFGKKNLKGSKILLRGKYQIENASLAIASIFLLKEKGQLSGNLNFKDALRNLFLEGRFEVLKNKPLIVSDIAHNEPSFCALSENLKFYYPAKEIILIFAASNDKDVKKMLKKIKYKHLILTRFNNPRSFAPEDLKNICNIKDAYLAENVKKALEIGKQLYNNGSIIVISGSLFLVSEAKALVQKRRIK